VFIQQEALLQRVKTAQGRDQLTELGVAASSGMKPLVKLGIGQIQQSFEAIERTPLQFRQHRSGVTAEVQSISLVPRWVAR